MTGYAHESAYAQFEVNFRPGEPLAQADAVFRFKRLARQVAERHGFLASFIAKPFLDQPGAGMHWHFSLQQTRDGANACWPTTARMDRT
jgi:glutamine synthetase